MTLKEMRKQEQECINSEMVDLIRESGRTTTAKVACKWFGLTEKGLQNAVINGSLPIGANVGTTSRAVRIDIYKSADWLNQYYNG